MLKIETFEKLPFLSFPRRRESRKYLIIIDSCFRRACPVLDTGNDKTSGLMQFFKGRILM